MHLSAPQLLGPDDFPRCHLDKRRPAEKGLRLLVDEDRVVRERWVICAAGRG